ncbi:MAG: bifunctional proline dehydrogenase/L-glutamate gamma-semialdehyde dehydrogenase [Legionellales bacterium RIFCSPHIGHO2_12_FULL_35_11]|nr:MAG: bifunctional proline dehydrogenase/L-glutamate gamma-semialdehyde dehydrogenase [Legionellales bacterium RIFCSPHIGHO2_12_FULL_35_11]
MFNKSPLDLPKGLRAEINNAYRAQETNIVNNLISYANLDAKVKEQVINLAGELVQSVRNSKKSGIGVDAILTEFPLSSDEGIALMCLAEALLRVPDTVTINDLIKDKIADADWHSHKGQSNSFFINAATWGLAITGKLLSDKKNESTFKKALLSLISRSGEGVVRIAANKAMRVMSKQFVMGRNIDEAIERAKEKELRGYRYSYDMLGEAALTAIDAERYMQSYTDAIEAIGTKCDQNSNLYSKPGISIKLSALHCRYEEGQKERVIKELTPKLLKLAQLAKKYDIGLTVDAEESERLEISLDVIERVFSDKSLEGWNGFGLAVQSYQKRAFYLLDWIAEISRSNNKRMVVRLIKGAYWDSEIKNSQMKGLDDYPVFTRKPFTDVSFQACAKKIMTMTDAIYPQFATHNAYSVAMILNIVGEYRDFEFQCLHGMGSDLYESIVPKDKFGIPCRVYAPVGSHEDLLPYLVRRLLENGANSSFVNQITDEAYPISNLVEDPIMRSKSLLDRINKNIPLPADIFQPERKNSVGIDLSNRDIIAKLQHYYAEQAPFNWQAEPIIPGLKNKSVDIKSVASPQNNYQIIGEVTRATEEDMEKALIAGENAFKAWSQTSVEERAQCLERLANLYEENINDFLALDCLEAGKTWSDGIAEVREAVDFCRYYAAIVRKTMGNSEVLKGYTGEFNELTLHPRGLVLCISPWNFPLAIFTGQIAAALVTGNCVLAKPADQTALIGYFAVKLMLKAGFPEGVIQFVPGRGSLVGTKLVADERIKAVIFTGSTATAKLINQTLAARGNEIIPLIAETGGQNAMIVDSSALLEQVILDVINSAFGSAGQRCSALRVLYVQEEVYPRILELLKGAMSELSIGDPRLLSTDVGPVIDKASLNTLKNHVENMRTKHKIIFECNLAKDCDNGYFMSPTAIAIDNVSALEEEMFGPVLHVVKYKKNELDDVINQINNTGYGLTLGIHSRVNNTVNYIRERVRVGNCYVNRNMTGAVVGLQPFGGEGLSGTGPKAGGPSYLHRLCVERTFTVNTTAAGGNASLMSLSDDNVQFMLS